MGVGKGTHTGRRGARSHGRWGGASAFRVVAVGVALVVALPVLAVAPLEPAGAQSPGQATGDSYGAFVSGDGGHVVFSSDAANLVAGDTNSTTDVFVLDTTSGQLQRVSVSSDGTEGDSLSTSGSLSDDGRFVAFDSWASNLVAGDTNGMSDVFVYDRSTGATERVSVASDGTEADNQSGQPVLSDDGLFVAFSSDASNLVAGDTNGMSDVFVYDRSTGATERVSVASDGTEADNQSGQPVLSDDGLFVAFSSDASNLVAGDTNGMSDVFVYDRSTGATERVSVASDGSESDNWSGAPALDGTGDVVAFQSDASNLVAGDANSSGDVFVYDRSTGATERVSVASDGSEGDMTSWGPAPLSDDARHVAFESDATNLVAADTNGVRDVFVHDRQTARTSKASNPDPSQPYTERASVASDGSQADDDSYTSAVSADGSTVVFTSDAHNLVPGYTNPDWNGGLYVRDRAGATTELVSVSSEGAPANAWGDYSPSLSADGRFVSFESEADNLVGGDTNGSGDVFVRDRQSGTTERASVASDGTEGDGWSYCASLSGDGRYVAFESEASNLVAGDTNGVADVFVRDRASGVTERVSVASDGSEGDGWAGCASISGDGRYVAFESDASNLVAGDTNGQTDVFARDRQSGTTEVVSVSPAGSTADKYSSVGRGAISGDGRFVAFSSRATDLVVGDTNGQRDVFVRDRVTAQTERVSVGPGGVEANSYSDYYPAMSEDGSSVAFSSRASNLVGGDTNAKSDVFLWDMSQRKAQRAGVDSEGNEGSQNSNTGGGRSVSADGGVVVFDSASTFVAGDTNAKSDVFARVRPATGNRPPSAAFTVAPEWGAIPLGVDVDASASGDSDGLVVDYQWNFGDGGTGSGVTASHVYLVPGAYQIALSVTDDDGASATATRSVTVLAEANAPPVAVADSYATPEEAALTVAAPGVLGNDTDPEGRGLLADLVGGPSHGDLQFASDGSFRYTPEADFSGEDFFTYQARDPFGGRSEVTTVSLTVTLSRLKVDNYLYRQGAAGAPDPWGFSTRSDMSFVAWALRGRPSQAAGEGAGGESGGSAGGESGGGGGVQSSGDGEFPSVDLDSREYPFDFPFAKRMGKVTWGDPKDWDETAAAAGFVVDQDPDSHLNYMPWAGMTVAHWDANEAGAGPRGHVAVVVDVEWIWRQTGEYPWEGVMESWAVVQEYDDTGQFAYRTVRAPRYIHFDHRRFSQTNWPEIHYAKITDSMTQTWTRDEGKIIGTTALALTQEDTNPGSDVYVYELATRTWELVSSLAADPDPGHRAQPKISADGTKAVYLSGPDGPPSSEDPVQFARIDQIGGTAAKEDAGCEPRESWESNWIWYVGHEWACRLYGIDKGAGLTDHSQEIDDRLVNSIRREPRTSWPLWRCDIYASEQVRVHVNWAMGDLVDGPDVPYLSKGMYLHRLFQSPDIDTPVLDWVLTPEVATNWNGTDSQATQPADYPPNNTTSVGPVSIYPLNWAYGYFPGENTETGDILNPPHHCPWGPNPPDAPEYVDRYYRWQWAGDVLNDMPWLGRPWHDHLWTLEEDNRPVVSPDGLHAATIARTWLFRGAWNNSVALRRVVVFDTRTGMLERFGPVCGTASDFGGESTASPALYLQRFTEQNELFFEMRNCYVYDGHPGTYIGGRQLDNGFYFLHQNLSSVTFVPLPGLGSAPDDKWAEQPRTVLGWPWGSIVSLWGSATAAYKPSITADGRYILYFNQERNLPMWLWPDDGIGHTWDVNVYDKVAQKTYRGVNTDCMGIRLAVWSASISPDGAWISLREPAEVDHGPRSLDEPVLRPFLAPEAETCPLSVEEDEEAAFATVVGGGVPGGVVERTHEGAGFGGDQRGRFQVALRRIADTPGGSGPGGGSATAAWPPYWENQSPGVAGHAVYEFMGQRRHWRVVEETWDSAEFTTSAWADTEMSDGGEARLEGPCTVYSEIKEIPLAIEPLVDKRDAHCVWTFTEDASGNGTVGLTVTRATDGSLLLEVAPSAVVSVDGSGGGQGGVLSSGLHVTLWKNRPNASEEAADAAWSTLAGQFDLSGLAPQKLRTAVEDMPLQAKTWLVGELKKQLTPALDGFQRLISQDVLACVQGLLDQAYEFWNGLANSDNWIEKVAAAFVGAGLRYVSESIIAPLAAQVGAWPGQLRALLDSLDPSMSYQQIAQVAVDAVMGQDTNGDGRPDTIGLGMVRDGLWDAYTWALGIFDNGAVQVLGWLPVSVLLQFQGLPGGGGGLSVCGVSLGGGGGVPSGRQILEVVSSAVTLMCDGAANPSWYLRHAFIGALFKDAFTRLRDCAAARVEDMDRAARALTTGAVVGAANALKEPLEGLLDWAHEQLNALADALAEVDPQLPTAGFKNTMQRLHDGLQDILGRVPVWQQAMGTTNPWLVIMLAAALLRDPVDFWTAWQAILGLGRSGGMRFGESLLYLTGEMDATITAAVADMGSAIDGEYASWYLQVQSYLQGSAPPLMQGPMDWAMLFVAIVAGAASPLHTYLPGLMDSEVSRGLREVSLGGGTVDLDALKGVFERGWPWLVWTRVVQYDVRVPLVGPAPPDADEGTGLGFAFGQMGDLVVGTQFNRRQGVSEGFAAATYQVEGSPGYAIASGAEMSARVGAAGTGTIEDIDAGRLEATLSGGCEVYRMELGGLVRVRLNGTWGCSWKVDNEAHTVTVSLSGSAPGLPPVISGAAGAGDLVGAYDVYVPFTGGLDLSQLLRNLPVVLSEAEWASFQANVVEPVSGIGDRVGRVVSEAQGAAGAYEAEVGGALDGLAQRTVVVLAGLQASIQDVTADLGVLAADILAGRLAPFPGVRAIVDRLLALVDELEGVVGTYVGEATGTVQGILGRTRVLVDDLEGILRSGVGDVGAALTEVIGELKTVFAGVRVQLSRLFTSVGDVARGLLEGVFGALDWLGDLVGALVDAVGAALGEFFAEFSRAVHAVIDSLPGPLQGLGALLNQAVGLVEMVGGVVQGVIGAARAVVGFLDQLRRMWQSWVLGLVRPLVTGLLNDLVGPVLDVVGGVLDMADVAVRGLVSVLDVFAGNLAGVARAVLDRLGAAVGRLGGGVGTLVGFVAGVLRTGLGRLRVLVGEVETIVDGQQVIPILERLWDDVVAAGESYGGDVGSLVDDVRASVEAWSGALRAEFEDAAADFEVVRGDLAAGRAGWFDSLRVVLDRMLAALEAVRSATHAHVIGDVGGEVDALLARTGVLAAEARGLLDSGVGDLGAEVRRLIALVRGLVPDVYDLVAGLVDGGTGGVDMALDIGRDLMADIEGALGVAIDGVLASLQALLAGLNATLGAIRAATPVALRGLVDPVVAGLTAGMAQLYWAVGAAVGDLRALIGRALWGVGGLFDSIGWRVGLAGAGVKASVWSLLFRVDGLLGGADTLVGIVVGVLRAAVAFLGDLAVGLVGALRAGVGAAVGAGSRLFDLLLEVPRAALLAVRGAVDVWEGLRSAVLVGVPALVSGAAWYGGAGDAPSGGDPAGGVALSSRGDWVAFASDASDLVVGDQPGTRDVFLRHTFWGMTRRVSVAPGGATPDGPSSQPAVDAGGRRVVFVSEATNLVAGDGNGFADVFVRDPGGKAGAALVSVAADGTGADGPSSSPAVSADGRFVAFVSDASSLVAGDGNGATDVFLRDLVAGTTTRVSAAAGGIDGDGASREPAMSDDGRWVAFTSEASNLTPGDTNGFADVFLFDRSTGTTVRVGPTAGEANGPSGSPSLAGDGSAVAFASSASNLVPGDTNAASDVFLFTPSTSALSRVSLTSSMQEGNGASRRPSVCRRGGRHYVAFESDATNLASGDANNQPDIFVRDPLLRLTVRSSTSAAGGSGNGASRSPVFSPSCGIVAFTSVASDLVGGDGNAHSDVVMRRIFA